MSVWNYVAIASACFIILLILVQTRGASIGAGLGGSGEMNTTRRGTEKSIFQIAIITTMVFALSLIMGIIA